MKTTSALHSEIQYILAIQNKLTEDSTQPPSNKRFPIKKNAKMMVALSPSYSFDFKENTLVLNSPEKETTITGSQIAAFSQLPKTEQVVFFSGTGEAGTHQAIIKNIHLKKVETPMKSFDQALEEGMDFAEQEELKWTKGMKLAFNTALADRDNIDSVEYKSILLTSQVRKSEAFKTLNKEIINYYNNMHSQSDEQKMFIDQVTACVTLAIQRLFKPILPKPQKKKKIPLFCSVKDMNGHAYDAHRFIHLLMVTHLLREMAHLVLVTSSLKIDYILHPKSRNPHENKAMNTVLRISMKQFAPKFPDLGQWLSYTLKLADIPKASVYAPPPEIKIHTSPMPISPRKDSSSDKDKNIVIPSSPEDDSGLDLSDSTTRRNSPKMKEGESFEEDVCESPPASPTYSTRSLENKQMEDILDMMSKVGQSHLPVETRAKYLALLREDGNKILRPATSSRHSPEPIIPAQPEEKIYKPTLRSKSSLALNSHRATHTHRSKLSASTTSSQTSTTSTIPSIAPKNTRQR